MHSQANLPFSPVNITLLLQSLQALGATSLEHVNGNLLTHLEGTYHYLKEWGNRWELCVAGLYHAVYSTHGYQHRLTNISQRESILQMIGIDAERIVYYFAACDRHDFYSRIYRKKPILLIDRFLNKPCVPNYRLFCDLLELTMANELEIARHSVSAKAQARQQFFSLFERFQPYVSQNAFQYYQEFFNIND